MNWVVKIGGVRVRLHFGHVVTGKEDRSRFPGFSKSAHLFNRLRFPDQFESRTLEKTEVKQEKDGICHRINRVYLLKSTNWPPIWVHPPSLDTFLNVFCHLHPVPYTSHEIKNATLLFLYVNTWWPLMRRCVKKVSSPFWKRNHMQLKKRNISPIICHEEWKWKKNICQVHSKLGSESLTENPDHDLWKYSKEKPGERRMETRHFKAPKHSFEASILSGG